MKNKFEVETYKYIENLHHVFFINQHATERLQETVEGLLMAQANRNERGVNVYKLRLHSILRDCKRKNPVGHSISATRLS